MCSLYRPGHAPTYGNLNAHLSVCITENMDEDHVRSKLCKMLPSVYVLMSFAQDHSELIPPGDPHNHIRPF
jgi:hypothetical protein